MILSFVFSGFALPQCINGSIFAVLDVSTSALWRILCAFRDREGQPVRNLVEVTFMSLNGVMDAPKLVQEAMPYFQTDQEHTNSAEKLLFAADALLLGRKTYEAFAEAYPSMAKSSPSGIGAFVDRMNSIPKYVASRTLTKELTQNKRYRTSVRQEGGCSSIHHGTCPSRS